MSLKYPVFSLLLLLGFWACEDTKKGTSAESETTAITPKETVAAEPVVEEVEPKEPEETYPLITNENAVEFLTQYGKDNPETKVRISTQHGDIELELYTDTPLHRANFIYLVKQEYFDGTFFHRIVPNFIIQGGNSDNRNTPRKRNKLGKKYMIPAELDNGRIHKRGTVSGAKEYRENPDKNSAPFEFFIYLGPPEHTAHLNGSYTIFGQVTKGMDVVDLISELPHDDGDWPLQNVYISAEVID
ncbi:peptidylprolyl isomerase [Aureitalea marina]|uniref:Peptidyl-prolyl cis-trans isomerase n=2 Tax=Aureitalea marina TaxID=930804 RepID=A0A2S7KPU8_9FLAO|nr:peptidylprolyl isomerase [Aureitalea marina]